MPTKPKRNRAGKDKGIAPSPKGKRGFQKGIAANPNGHNGARLLFGTRDPFKQALIRSLKEAEETDSPQNRAVRLAAIAENLMREASQSKRNPIEAIRLLATTLDGKPQENVPPVQVNTFQLVLQNIRKLNLTDEQLEALENGSTLAGLPDFTG